MAKVQPAAFASGEIPATQLSKRKTQRDKSRMSETECVKDTGRAKVQKTRELRTTVSYQGKKKAKRQIECLKELCGKQYESLVSEGLAILQQSRHIGWVTHHQCHTERGLDI